MLHVEGGNGSVKGIVPERDYCVWDSDDFIAEKCSGREIIEAYKGGIKFGNISKKHGADDVFLYVNKSKCSLRDYYTRGVIESNAFYCSYYETEYNSGVYCILFWYNDSLYKLCWFDGSIKGGIGFVPVIQNKNGEKKYMIVDMITGHVLRMTFSCNINKARLKRVLALKGMEYVFKKVVD